MILHVNALSSTHSGQLKTGCAAGVSYPYVRSRDLCLAMFGYIWQVKTVCSRGMEPLIVFAFGKKMVSSCHPTHTSPPPSTHPRLSILLSPTIRTTLHHPSPHTRLWPGEDSCVPHVVAYMCMCMYMSRVILVPCHTCHVPYLSRVILDTSHTCHVNVPTCHVAYLSRVTLVCYTCHV